MAMTIKDVNLLSLQTKYMQQDPTTIGLCAALTPQFKKIAEEVSLCVLLANVDKLPEPVLDELAYELHIDWYDATVSIDIKRNLIKNSDKVHMSLGTPYAAEQVIQDYFGDGYVEEWFEYGGDPYFFKVITGNPSVTSELANQFTKAITAVKRGSAFLEEIVINLTADLNYLSGGIVQTGDYITIEQVV